MDINKQMTYIPSNYYCKFSYTLPSSNWNLNIFRFNADDLTE